MIAMMQLFVYGLCTLITGKTKQPNKKTNKSVTRLTKRFFRKTVKKLS